MQYQGFIAPSGEARSERDSVERSINFYVEPLDTNPRQFMLYSFPGLMQVAVLPSAPVRGLYTTTTGRTFAATSTTLFEVFAGWSITSRGTIPTGTQQVSMTDNGQQMVLSVQGQGLLYDLAANTLTPIVPGEPALVFGRVQYLSTYFVTNNVGTSQFFYSDILDGATWPALSYYRAEARGDSLVTLYADHNELWLFGSQTVEIWHVTGDSLRPFTRSSSQFLEQGTIAPWSVNALDSTLYWLGGSPRGEGPAYKAQGYQPVRISTRNVERVRSGIQTVGSALSMTARQGGHAWYMVWWPDTETTWAYDTLTSAWTELAALNEDGSLGPWPVNQHCIAFDVHLWGSYTDGSLYVWHPGHHWYGDRPRYCERTGPFLRADEGGSKITFSSFQLQCLTGQGLDGAPTGGVGVDPQYRLSWSADGETWSYPLWRGAGPLGRRERRVTWRRLGQDYERAFKVATTDPVFHAWRGAVING